MQNESKRVAGELNEAMDRLNAVVLDGLAHGFFQCTVSCELIKDRKRRFTIQAGKSHQFTIPEEELLKLSGGKARLLRLER